MDKGKEGFENQPPREPLREFDVLASVDMMRTDITRHGRVLPETFGQIYDEELTYVAEGINAPLKTRFVLEMTPQGLADKKGRLLDDTLARGVRAAEEAAFGDSRLWFNVERAVHDYREGQLIEEMMRGEREETTLVSFSPFPEEAYQEHGAELVKSKGYRPDRLMGFIRVYNKLNDNQLEVTTISVDNSDLDAYTHVANQLGVEIPSGTTSGSVLGFRYMGTLDSSAQALLPDKLLRLYDEAMAKLYPEAGEFSAGRPKADEVEAWSFIEAQKDLVHVYFMQLEEMARGGFDDRLTMERQKKKLTYGFWAALKDRLKALPPSKELTVREFTGSAEQVSQLQREIDRSYKLAAARGDELVGCGSSMKAEKDDLLDMSPSDALSEIMDDKESSWVWKKGVCQVPKCTSPKPTEVGPCKVCRKCQKKSDDGADLMTLYQSDDSTGRAQTLSMVEQLFGGTGKETEAERLIGSLFSPEEIKLIEHQEQSQTAQKAGELALSEV